MLSYVQESTATAKFSRKCLILRVNNEWEIQDIFGVRQFARRVLGQWNVRGFDGLNM
jgi:hypothetical protein